jgi:hypothetical protein
MLIRIITNDVVLPGEKFEQVRVVDGVTRKIAVMQCHEPPGPKAMAWAQVVMLVFNVEDAERYGAA